MYVFYKKIIFTVIVYGLVPTVCTYAGGSTFIMTKFPFQNTVEYNLTIYYVVLFKILAPYGKLSRHT